MGLHMDDIHAPTVPSGPSSGVQANGSSKDQLTLKQLIDEKERVEAELTALGAVLDSHGVNMNTGLTTFDGFPRSDIDVPQIRTTRARIIHLKNDYKDLMSRIEKGLHDHHAALAASNASQATSSSSSAPSAASSSSAGLDVAFAKVNSVVDASPAAQAGLRAGDLILRFGTADWMNHEKLSKVAEVVSQNERRTIQVKISRQESPAAASQESTVFLIPRRDWGGRGLLGCHLVPL